MHYDNKKTNKNFLNYFQQILIRSAPLISASYSLFLSVILLTLVGYYLDKKFDTFPILFLVGLFFGLMLGFYQLLKVISSQKEWCYTHIQLYYSLVWQALYQAFFLMWLEKYSLDYQLQWWLGFWLFSLCQNMLIAERLLWINFLWGVLQWNLFFTVHIFLQFSLFILFNPYHLYVVLQSHL